MVEALHYLEAEKLDHGSCRTKFLRRQPVSLSWAANAAVLKSKQAANAGTRCCVMRDDEWMVYVNVQLSMGSTARKLQLCATCVILHKNAENLNSHRSSSGSTLSPGSYLYPLPRHVAMTSTLVVSELTREIDNKPIFASVSFSLDQGDILFVRGPSGVGKSVLLRSLAALDPIQVHHAYVVKPTSFTLHPQGRHGHPQQRHSPAARPPQLACSRHLRPSDPCPPQGLPRGPL